MTNGIELWHMVLLLLAFFGFCGAALKLIFQQLTAQLDERFQTQEAAHKAHSEQLNMRLDTLEKAAREETSQWQRVERELLNLKADLPVHYVRREDYIRGQSVIEAKLDGLGTKVENALLRFFHNAT